jgi:hypothetical protein
MVVESLLLTCAFIIDYQLHAVKRSLWPRPGLWSVPCLLPQRSLLKSRAGFVNWARVVCPRGAIRLSIREGDRGTTSLARYERLVRAESSR